MAAHCCHLIFIIGVLVSMKHIILIIALSFNLTFAQNNWLVFDTTNTGIYDENIISLAKDKQGILWILSNSGALYHFDGVRIKNIKFKIDGIPSNSISKIKIDKMDNKYFLSKGYGLIKLDINGQLTIFDSSNSGIGNDVINDIAFDKFNNLWIGTDNGLVNYDGNSWSIYRTNNSGIPRNDVSAVAIDNFNTKWIGFQGTYNLCFISKFNDTSWINFRDPDGIRVRNIKIIFIDSRNVVWIGHTYGALRYINGKWNNNNFQTNTISPLIFTEDKIGNVWFGYDPNPESLIKSRGICYYDYTTDTFYLSREVSEFYKFPNSPVLSLFADSLLYIGTMTKGLAIFNDTSIFKDYKLDIYDRTTTGIKNSYIKTISVDKNNSYWIGTYGSGISKLTAIKDTLIWESHIPNTIIYSISFDSSGNVWAGTMYEGLFRYNGVQWDTFTTQNSILPSNIIVTIKVDRNNVKWIGTNRGLVKIEDTEWTLYNTQNSPLPGNTIGSIVVDNQNNKWFGTENGLVKYDGTNWVVYNSTNSPLPDNIILSLELDGSGNLWIGTWNGGVAKFDGNNWIIFNKDNSPLPSNRIRSLRVDNNNVMWIGTETNGLVRYDGQSWQLFDIYNSPLPNNFINGLAVDKFNHKLIATNEGLAIYREDGIVVEVEDKPETKPERFILHQNYPNPFNLQTKIRYTIPEGGRVSLRVYNIIGEEVANLVDRYLTAGEYETEFNASNLPSGIYIYRLSSEKFTQVKKMLLIK